MRLLIKELACKPHEGMATNNTTKKLGIRMVHTSLTPDIRSVKTK